VQVTFPPTACATAGNRAILLLVMVLITLVAPAAQAQSPLPVDQQLDRFRRAAASGLGVPSLTSLALTGREDLLVLEEVPFFTAYATTALGYSNNVLNSNDDKQSDWNVSVATGLLFRATIAERYDVFAQLGYIASRYERVDTLSFDGFQGRVGVSVADVLAGARVTLSYSPSFAYEVGLDGSRLRQHGIVLDVSRPIELQPTVFLTPALTVMWAPSDPDDYTSTSVRGSLLGQWQIGPSVVLYAQIDGTYRSYDDFFPAQFTEDREDTTLAVTGGVLWQPSDLISLNANVSYASSDSTIDRFDYQAVGVTPTVSLQVKF
jgi:hypothetical protein